MCTIGYKGLIHRIFYLLVSALFFTCFAAENIKPELSSAQKKGYLVWSRGGSSACAHVGRRSRI